MQHKYKAVQNIRRRVLHRLYVALFLVNRQVQRNVRCCIRKDLYSFSLARNHGSTDDHVIPQTIVYAQIHAACGVAQFHID